MIAFGCGLFVFVWLAAWGWIIERVMKFDPPLWLLLPSGFLGFIILALGVWFPVFIAFGL